MFGCKQPLNRLNKKAPRINQGLHYRQIEKSSCAVYLRNPLLRVLFNLQK